MDGNVRAAVREYYDRGNFDLDIPITGQKWFVDTINGSDTHSGKSWKRGKSFLTVAKAFEKIVSGDSVVIQGVVREQLLAPQDIFDIKIIGGANRPRQATDGGVATGGGACWIAPAAPTAATPLLELREQAWTLRNIFMASPADAAAVKLHREETATYADASHASFVGCHFAGFLAIEDYGGQSNVLIDDCQFAGLAGAGGGALKVTNQGIAIPSRYLIQHSRFLENVNQIVGAFVDSVIRYNQIHKATTTTVNLATGNVGLRNQVLFNYFNIAAVDFDPVGGVVGNATDQWVNYLTDALEFGQPAN